MIELKPCPFCGEDLIATDATWEHGGADRRCIADTVTLFDADDMDAWNTRTPPTPEGSLRAALQSARGLIDKLGTDFPEAEQKFNGEWASYRDEFDAALTASPEGPPDDVLVKIVREAMNGLSGIEEHRLREALAPPPRLLYLTMCWWRAKRLWY